MISVLWFVKYYLYHEKINLEIKTSISHFKLTDGVAVIILQLLILYFCVYSISLLQANASATGNEF